MTTPEQIVVTQADIEAARSIAWVPGVIDDEEAIAETFARHRIAATRASEERIAGLVEAFKRIIEIDTKKVPFRHGYCFYTGETYTDPAHTEIGPCAEIAAAALAAAKGTTEGEK